MTWSVRGIDDEVRETALAAARRSGKPVGEWLNGVIRQTATETAETPPRDGDNDVGRLERGLAQLAARLDRLRAPVAEDRPRFVAEPAGNDDRLASVLGALDALDRRLQALAQPARAVAVPPAAPAPAAAPVPRLDELEQAIAAIGRRQQALEPQRPPGPERHPAARPLLASDIERHFKDLSGRLDRLAEAPPPSGDARARDDRLGSELRDLRGVIEQNFASRVAPLAETVGDLRLGLDRLVEEVARGRRDDRLDSLADRLAALSRDVAAPKPDPALDALARAQADLADRIEALGRDIATPKPDPALDVLARVQADLADRIEALGRDIAAPKADPVLDQLAQAQSDLLSRIEALRADAADAGAVADLRAEIAELRADLASREPGAGFGALENRLAGLGRRIDQLVAGRGESLAALDEIRRVLAEPRPAPELGRVEDRLDQLDQRLAALRGIEAGIVQLARRIDGLEAGGNAPTALAAVAEEIAALTDRLDRLPQAPAAVAPALADLDDRLAAIGAGIERLEHRAAAPVAAATSIELPGLGGVAERLEAAAARLDRLAPPDTALIAAIDDKFAQIARQLDTAEDRFATLGAIEDALVEMHSILNHRGPAGETEAAARAAVAEFVRLTETAGSAKALDSIVAELSELKTQTHGLEARTADGLKAVQEALASVAGLLQQNRGVGRAARNPREDARPLEPGSGKPEVAAAPAEATAAPAEPVPAAVTAIVAAPAEEAATEADAAAPPSRRADFIAAARRAAQAAQAARIAEPEPDLDGADAHPHRGALARIGAALRGRARPVATIVAVLLLAGIATEISLNGLERLSRGLEPIGSRIAAVAPDTAREPARDPGPAAAPAIAEAPKPDPIETGAVAEPKPEAEPARPSAGDLLAAPVQPGGFGAVPAPAPGFVAQPPAEAAPAARPSYPLPEERVGSLPLRQAAASGDAGAAFEIGQRYAEGRGVAQNGVAALEWFRRAAEAGLAPAQYRLASGLEKGLAGNRDLAEAKRWYRAAAEQGNVRAMHNLGVIYANERDMAGALPWFQKAGDLGLKDSQFNLGIVHALGSGVKQDLAVAYKWFALAAAQGDQEAAKKRDDLVQYLDKTALASAKLAVDTWKAKPLDRAANDEQSRWTETAAATPVRPADPAAERLARVQTLLKAQGAYAGPVDGAANAEVKAAVKAFQRKAGLKPTGEVDDALVRALTAGKAV